MSKTPPKPGTKSNSDPNPITTTNISHDEVTTSPPGLREAQAPTFWSRPVNVIIATLDINHSAIGVQGVLHSWWRLHTRYTEDLTFRRCLSITERKVIVAKLEEDIARLDRALMVYMSTDIGGREFKRGPGRNVWDHLAKSKREGRMARFELGGQGDMGGIALSTY